MIRIPMIISECSLSQPDAPFPHLLHQVGGSYNKGAPRHQRHPRQQQHHRQCHHDQHNGGSGDGHRWTGEGPSPSDRTSWAKCHWKWVTQHKNLSKATQILKHFNRFDLQCWLEGLQLFSAPFSSSKESERYLIDIVPPFAMYNVLIILQNKTTWMFPWIVESSISTFASFILFLVIFLLWPFSYGTFSLSFEVVWFWSDVWIGRYSWNS